MAGGLPVAAEAPPAVIILRMGLVRVLAVWLLVLGTSGCAGWLPGGPDSAASRLSDGRPPIVSDRFLLAADQQVVGELQVIEAGDLDTFVDIARTYNLGFDELVAANPGVDPWLPGEGTRILLPTRFVLPDVEREGIVINIASKRLFFFPPPNAEGGREVITHPIGIGREGAETPTGITTVTSKGRDPVWFPPASIRREYAAAGNPLPPRVMPGPDNPLGKFVLVLGMPSYLIHGTNKPAGVGMRVSHGCVRLFPENIAALFDLAPVGVQVNIVNEPFLLGWHDGQLLLEAHAPLQDDERDPQRMLDELLAAAVAATGSTVLADTQRVADVRDAALGIPLPVLAAAPATAAIIGSVQQVNNLVAHLQPDEAN